MDIDTIIDVNAYMFDNRKDDSHTSPTCDPTLAQIKQILDKEKIKSKCPDRGRHLCAGQNSTPTRYIASQRGMEETGKDHFLLLYSL